MRWRRAAAAALALVGNALALAGDAPSLPVASDGHNVWIVTERMTPTGIERVLLHHSPQMGGPYAREVLAFRESPLGMAATNARLWLVMPPQDAVRTRREVYTVSVGVHHVTGVHLYEPQGRLTILPSLPGDQHFDGVVPLGQHVMALLGRGVPDVLGPAGWEPLPHAPSGVMVLPWAQGAALVTCAEPFEVWIPTAGDSGQSMAIPLQAGARVLGVTGASLPAGVVCAADGTMALSYMRETGPVPLVTLPAMAGPWAIAGLEQGFAILEADGTGAVRMRRVDGVSGIIDEAVTLTPPPSKAGQWILLILAGVLIVLLAVGSVLLLNPSRAPRDAAPYGYAPLPPMRRLLALAIDLIPGVAVVLALGYPAGSLVQSPIVSATGAAAVPSLIMIVIAVGGCVIGEVASGASVGKWVVGGRVARMAPAGAKPAVWQVLVRNIFKAFVLIVPMAAIFNIWTPGLRGIGEVLTRTGVIDRRSGPQPLKPGSTEGR